MTLDCKENIGTKDAMSDGGSPVGDESGSRAAELLRKKQELEAELRKIESELEKSNPPSHSVRFEDSFLSGGFSQITPKKRKFIHGYSPKNRWDAFTSPIRHLNTDFDTSSVFDLSGAFVTGKKEALLAFNGSPTLAQLTDDKETRQKRYYLGCIAGPAQEHLLTCLKTSRNAMTKRLSECNTVVYHEDLVSLPSYMRRRLMLAAMAGFDFVGITELVNVAESDSTSGTSEFSHLIEECKTISEYIRQCYGAGMAKPFDGRIMAVYIADEKNSQDVLDAVCLLGGNSIVIGPKDKVPVGISHLIHDMRDLKEKNSPLYHKINYNSFFKDLETEFDRLRIKAAE